MAFALFALFAVSSIAECRAAELRSGVDQRRCHAELAEKTDREMAQQWRHTFAAMRRSDATNRHEKLNVPDLAASLLSSQRAWLRYRDAQCNVVSNQAAGGTGYGDLGSLCEIELNQQRTVALQRLADGNLMPKVK